MTTSLGAATLTVADLDRMTEFYTHAVGLTVREQTDARVTLGTSERPLLHLLHKPDGKRYRRTTGLFHFALLTPSRTALGNAFHHMLHAGVPLQGASDHLASEAIYLADPEGNGIEVYRDRPRAEWTFRDDGSVEIATIQMDADGVLAARDDAPWAGLAAGTVMGHMHLHVGDIPTARTFYAGLMGMDVMTDVGSALFLSYDGYHHHLGANVWGGKTPPPPDALGLHSWDLHVGERLAPLLDALRAGGVPIEAVAEGRYHVQDPWQNTMILSS